MPDTQPTHPELHALVARLSRDAAILQQAQALAASPDDGALQTAFEQALIAALQTPAQPDAPQTAVTVGDVSDVTGGKVTVAGRDVTQVEIAQLIIHIGAQPPPEPPTDNRPPADRPADNPFYTGGAVPPELFAGRQRTLAFVRQRLGGRSLQSASIVGERRIGKSSVLRYVHERAAELFDPQTVVIYFDLMRAAFRTRSGFMKSLRRALGRVLGKRPWEARDDADLATLTYALEDLSDSGVRLVLCLDEMGQLTRDAAEFDGLLEELRGAGQLGQIGMLTASARPLADLCGHDGISSPFFNIFEQETLGLLAEHEWRALVRERLGGGAEQLAAIEQLAGGHPFYIQVAAECIWRGDSDWQNTALDKITPHWDSQWRHLGETERAALWVAAGKPGPAPVATTMRDLARRGLLGDDGKPFSAAYAAWVVAQ